MDRKDEIICYCSNVTRGDIEQAMNDGAKTLKDIKLATGACTVCRCEELNPKKKCCCKDIREVMSEYAKQHPEIKDS
ncbi:MAG: (2Fe-2S)-binding protein [Phoenicibacter congonensis]|uniref:(2Fe-2S)-binding protein n=1 Tax=Phoenicibacter congonensis TaxID=1944646 RepID=A0AA43RGF9_9ACTN|nr:(2Fe-2S)-binding protein [Phoenicibacter congonensis]